MKVFMVFITLILVFSCLCVHINDMALYRQLNIALIELADEAANAVAFCATSGWTGSSENSEPAGDYLEFLINQAKSAPLFKNGELSYAAQGTTVTVSFTPHYNLFHIFPNPTYPLTQSSTYIY